MAGEEDARAACELGEDVVVAHLTRDVEIDAAAALEEAAAGARREGDGAHGRARAMAAARGDGEVREAEVALRALGDFRERRRGVEHEAAAGAGSAPRSRHERVDVPGGLFVGMHAGDGARRGGQRAPRTHHLEAELGNALELSGAPDGGVRAFVPEEGAFTREGERAARVGADHARAGFREGVPQGVRVIFRHEDDELEVVRLGRRRGKERLDAPRAEALREPVVQAEGRGVERRVR